MKSFDIPLRFLEASPALLPLLVGGVIRVHFVAAQRTGVCLDR